MITWYLPEELIEIGFARSRVVMMNEAHSGLQRCVRTREVGRRILPTAHRLGVRHLAMEAFYPQFAEAANRTRQLPEAPVGYLTQPEMRTFVQAALDLSWELIVYEADPARWLNKKHGIQLPSPAELSGPEEATRTYGPYQSEFMSQAFTNWREEQQARNLIAALAALPTDAKLVVWCGNGHLTKTHVNAGPVARFLDKALKPLTRDKMSEWAPMGYWFRELSGIDPFVIDQTRSVNFDARYDQPYKQLVTKHVEELNRRGGTAGFLSESAPSLFPRDDADAYLLSTQNELE